MLDASRESSEGARIGKRDIRRENVGESYGTMRELVSRKGSERDEIEGEEASRYTQTGRWRRGCVRKKVRSGGGGRGLVFMVRSGQLAGGEVAVATRLGVERARRGNRGYNKR